MFRIQRYLLSTLLGYGMAMGGFAQDCINLNQYPFDVAITPDPAGLQTEVSTCIFFGEFTHFTGIEIGSTYKFTINGNGYITLRQGTSGGAVVTSGYDYVIYTATSTDDLFAHYTANETCGTGSNCQINTVQLLPDCVPPLVTYEWVEDCATGEFFVQFTITDMGDSPDLLLEYDISGTPGSIAELSVGTVDVGPIMLGDVVNIAFVYGNAPDCDISFTGLTPFSDCPIQLACGDPATDLSYCYELNASRDWLFEGLGSGSLLLNFESGMIGGGDILTIYDGTDATAPILFEHILWNDLDMAGITVVSTGPSMYMTLVSDGWGSCTDGIYGPLDWNIACLDCTLPQVSTSIVEDCANNQFSIEVDIATTGDGATVDIEYAVNGQAAQIMSGASTGISIIGPFTVNDQVQVNILHELDGMCDLDLGVLTDPGNCPTLVNCGTGDINETYCYENLDSEFWLYQLVGTEGALYLQFNSGTIESNFYDQLAIYDGMDASGPLLFQHISDIGMDLSGIAVTSTTGYLYMVMSSDGSSSCFDNSQTSWDWIVTCLECTPANATFQVSQNCVDSLFYIDVDIVTLGNDPELTITNTGGLTDMIVTTTGVHQVGPFEFGTSVQLTLVNDSNSLCNVISPIMTNPLCPEMVCGTTPLAQTYCYTANDDMAWAYEVSGTGTVHLVFDLGTIESDFYDVLTIYDGPDELSPILFQHIGSTMELGPDGSAVIGPAFGYYGVDVTTTGQNLYMTLTSDGSVQCDDPFSSFDPMEWHVSCEGCEAPGVSYTLEADCEHLVYKAQVNVTEMTGPNGLQITEMGSGETIAADQVNTYNFTSFFDLDSTVQFQVVDLDNVGCTYESDIMVYTRDSCVINSCGLDNYELCYENDEDRWFTYRSMGDMPVAIYFYQGQMLPGDVITLYNGLIDSVGTVIFSGNNSGNLTGLTVNSSNANNALTLHIQSDGASSCVDGASTIPLRWDVGCGFVGIETHDNNGFSMYPNPTNGLLNIDLGEAHGAIDIRVMDMSGRLIHQRSMQENAGKVSIDLSNAQNGHYLVSITTADRIITKPLQVIR